MKVRKWPILVVLVVGVLFGYGQEYVKIAVNFAIECSGYGDWDSISQADRLDQLNDCRQNRPTDYYHNHKPLEVLGELSQSGLTMVKWGMAFIFILFHWVLARWGLTKSYSGNFPVRILDIGTVGLVAMSVLVFGMGRIFHLAPAYDVAREILGALQSLIPYVILVLGYSLYLRLNN